VANTMYGAPKFQEEMEHRTRHDRCGLPGCYVIRKLQTCSRHKIRRHCCTDHQKADWKDHKHYCHVPVVDIPGPAVSQPPEGYLYDMTHCEQSEKALKIAERLEEFIISDLYPPKEEELIYGIEMNNTYLQTGYVGIDYPIGVLTYSAWKFLHRAYIEFESHASDDDDEEAFERAVFLFRYQVAQALLAGELPSWFQKSVELYRKKFLEEELYVDAYVKELRRQEYKGIKRSNKVLEQLKVWPRPGDSELSPPSTDPYFWLNS
jgi:hypothetical protein